MLASLGAKTSLSPNMNALEAASLDLTPPRAFVPEMDRRRTIGSQSRGVPPGKSLDRASDARDAESRGLPGRGRKAFTWTNVISMNWRRERPVLRAEAYPSAEDRLVVSRSR
jgi:hypothetical protein